MSHRQQSKKAAFSHVERKNKQLVNKVVALLMTNMRSFDKQTFKERRFQGTTTHISFPEVECEITEEVSNTAPAANNRCLPNRSIGETDMRAGAYRLYSTIDLHTRAHMFENLVERFRGVCKNNLSVGIIDSEGGLSIDGIGLVNPDEQPKTL